MYSILSVISYQAQVASSGAAWAGAGMGVRAMTRGFKSIISRWSCRKLRAVAREMEGGRGVMVVKVVRLDMDIMMASIGARDGGGWMGGMIGR